MERLEYSRHEKPYLELRIIFVHHRIASRRSRARLCRNGNTEMSDKRNKSIIEHHRLKQPNDRLPWLVMRVNRERMPVKIEL